ncbi:Aspartate-tRNA synthetase, type 2 like protein [Aduncisulcus paluster]|uniref:Aspartate-tRNA synthetase, type 2 like protein n=1 Tax=Aduncisulcus paluster TaxID=2918883 RepID=A0ABQ5K5I3_9EUKA|nr:Aspartate-tRNA synthetase, type 2 like protein [Aduncisulcus paluster]
MAHLEKTCAKEFEILKVDLPKIDKIPRMPLEEARDLLLEEFGHPSPKGNIDAEGEKLLAKYIKDEYDSEFVFLTKYPAAKPAGIDPKAVDFYIESFKYGMPPHGGFAIGLERITMMILGLDNIRHATILPRDLNRVTP